ncbi:hypothetical protein D3C75_552600 [compost metagenome]
MGKRRCRSRVSVVIRRYVDCLNRCNGTFFSRCDTLLQLAHFSSQSRLITNRGWHTAEKSGYFGTRLGKAEYIIDKEQRIAAFHITEIFRHGQTGQSYTKTCTWRLVHLSEDHCCLLNNAGIRHFVIKVITFTSTFTDTCEYGNTTVLLGNVINQFLDCYCFTYAGTAEEADFTTLSIRCEQVDNFNTCFQDFRLC